ncbi:hypothetical protein WJX79_010815 [Trebouxia sp. C0005]
MAELAALFKQLHSGGQSEHEVQVILTSERGSTPHSYHSQLLQVVKEVLTDTSDAAAPAAFMHFMKVKGHKKEGKQTKGVPAAWHIAAEGAALLVGAMRAGNVYRPTEDTRGRHRLLLADLADTVLQHAKVIMQGALSGSTEQRQRELVAVCGVLSAILAVEHRAVQPHLAHIWQLLWLAAQEKDGLTVATAVAAGLVGAYAELRQLQFLLQSVLEAMLAQHPATAAALICTPSFVSALARAVREMPSGQAAPMITFAAEHLPSLATLPVSSPTQAAFAQILSTCLANIRIEVVSAPTLADAVAELLQNSLAPALGTGLSTQQSLAAVQTGTNNAYFSALLPASQPDATLPSLPMFWEQASSAFPDSTEDDFEGSQTFVHWLSTQLQESPHSCLEQQTGISRINVSSHGSVTQRGTLLVIAEAVLAAVVQAEAGASPTKRKKAAADVVTGPVMTVQNQVKPQQLQSIALPLEVAIKDILTCQISQAQSPRPVLGSQTPDRARTAAAESVEAAAAHTLQESAEVDGGKHNSVDDASDTMVASGLPWVLSSLTQQVAWLTDVLQLPWQLVPGKGLGLSGRLELTLNSAHHVFGYLQAVAATLHKLDAQIGQTLWLPLLTLHIHALATLSPILQAPLPLRHAGSAPMGIPTLVAPADPKLKPYNALRKTLLLALRDLLKNSNREQQQQLYPQLTQALAAAQSSSQALPYLEALLVALETPRSPRGLHLLARHSQDVVSALLLFITAATDISSPSASARISADSRCHTPQQPVVHCSVRRCMALVGASTRALLKMLMHWSQATLRGLAHEGLLVVCASEVAQLYTTIAADKAGLGKYCLHLLADYITSVAAPPLHALSIQSAATLMAAMQQARETTEALTGPAATALRQGALALYGACSPAEVQHIHASLSGAWGGMQRVALADLRREYEADYRYTGKSSVLVQGPSPASSDMKATTAACVLLVLTSLLCAQAARELKSDEAGKRHLLCDAAAAAAAAASGDSAAAAAAAASGCYGSAAAAAAAAASGKLPQPQWLAALQSHIPPISHACDDSAAAAAAAAASDDDNLPHHKFHYGDDGGSAASAAAAAATG